MRPRPPRTLFLVNGSIAASLFLAAVWTRLPLDTAKSVADTPADRAALRQSRAMVGAIHPAAEPTILLSAAHFGTGKRAETYVTVIGTSPAQEHLFSFVWDQSGEGIVEISNHLPPPQTHTALPGAEDALFWLRRIGVLGASGHPPKVVLHREGESTRTYRAGWGKNLVQISLERGSGNLKHLRVLKSGASGIRPAPVAFLEDRPPIP